MKRLFDIFRRKPSEPQQPQINYQLVGNPQPVQPVQSFKVDELRHQVVMALLQGSPYFVVYQTPTEIKTVAAIGRPELAAGLKQMALKHDFFKDDLTNIVIDAHTNRI